MADEKPLTKVQTFL